MKTNIVLAFAATLLANMSNAQDFENESRLKPISFIFETGITARSSNDIAERPNLRRPHDDDFCCDLGHDAHVRQYHFDFKPEFMLNNKLSFNAGLRFTSCIGEMARNSAYPIWYVGSEGTDTYWVSTRRITQHSFYLGIPAELRFAPADIDDASFVLKFGLAANVLLGKRNKAASDHETKSEDIRKIEKWIGSPDRFTLPVWMSAGCQVGPDGDVTIEVKFPVLMRYNNTFSMCKFEFGGIGLAFGVRLKSLVLKKL